MKTLKEYISENNKTEYTDYKKWENAAKAVNKNVKVTEEGHGGSKALIASIPGSANMIGKWFGDSKSGKGWIAK